MNKAPGKTIKNFNRIFWVVIAATSLFAYALIANQNTEQYDRKAFAYCLSKAGLIMYGVDTCEYCQMQKKMFGDAFEKINYVNCDFEKKICLEKGINAYPVWEYKGIQMRGIQTFNTLSQTTNCDLPKEY